MHESQNYLLLFLNIKPSMNEGRSWHLRRDAVLSESHLVCFSELLADLGKVAGWGDVSMRGTATRE